MSFDDWFLTARERGNDSTALDRRHGDADAWTTGNEVEPLIDGASYFGRLYDALCATERGDRIWFTDWRGDADERLRGPGTEIAWLLADRARAGVDVRGLVWRSHSDKMRFSEKENLTFVETVNAAGGEVLLDERVHHAGSHHQKLVLVRRRDEAQDVAFVGGIDLSHGRHDDARHLGDSQAISIDRRYGSTPAWHDVHTAVRGPAVDDLEWCFRERWSDPAPLDHRNPVRAAFARAAHEPRTPGALPPRAGVPPAIGHHAVQVLRTYPARTPGYPFAPRGERSVARAYLKAFSRATRLIYIEDQYLWSADAAGVIAKALRRAPELRVIAVVPRYPDRSGKLSGAPYGLGQDRFFAQIGDAADRVAILDLENERGMPVYVHAKVCVVDDTWLAVGSDNLNRRSWTNDSELSIAVLDEHGQLAQNTRLRLWCEHLQHSDTDDLIDPITGFEAMTAAARALDDWHRAGRHGERPVGRLRYHARPDVPMWSRPWANAAYRSVIDPDGRPLAMRLRNAF